MKSLIATTVAIILIASSAAIADEDRASSPSRSRVAKRTAAQAARLSVSDIDADLRRGGRLRPEAETRAATTVTFIYGDRRYAGRVVDRDEGAREWARTVRARGRRRRRPPDHDPGARLRRRRLHHPQLARAARASRGG